MSGPVTSPPTYFTVFAALIGLTLLTVGLSFLELGAWHTPVGVAIGAAKAVLVGLFFMHLWHSTRLTRVVVAAGLFWVTFFLLMTLTDYLTRPWLAY
jgi:cytochrome c oxidase subunit 4